ncbi:MAG: 1-deoxy-D-xylulose-5-phosphate reductoisomerase [Sphaerochaetaceae bacterium]|nr:1-deoxy-D-xylulose-5-phosphate reductoisomerase [Sphaerochaetaceae bacterium]
MTEAVILGLTGSIGQTAVRGCKSFKDNIHICGASVHSRVEQALSVCLENNIPNLCITSDAPCPETDKIRIWRNLKEMLLSLKADVVLNGISGSEGLKASVTVMETSPVLALANKESVVMGGSLLFSYAREHNCKIIPVDSEHSAIDELILTQGRENVSSLVITASGGPFRNSKPEELENITAAQAVKHPTWNMGPKISIDSATLANKGLEVIEAHYLFNFPADKIEVVIHPQSVVHSMVRTTSGQVYAQMSPPDMVFPIMRALLLYKFPHEAGKALDFTNLNLSFSALDSERFPFVSDAFECVRLEGAYPTVYNTANEIAVDAFIRGKIKFTQIRSVVRKALDLSWSEKISSFDDIYEIQAKVKRQVVL